MCILIVKPKGAEFPKIENMEECFYNNPDGFGYAEQSAEYITIKKGYMDVESALIEYEKILARDRVDLNYLFHFRIGTHGIKAAPSHCHPFPVTHNEKLIKSRHVRSRRAFAHNGIMHALRSNDYSDSMLFVDKILTDIMDYDPKIEHKMSRQIIEGMLGWSKIAIMTNTGDIVTFGEFIEDEGVLYSNNTYRIWPKYNKAKKFDELNELFYTEDDKYIEYKNKYPNLFGRSKENDF